MPRKVKLNMLRDTFSRIRNKYDFADVPHDISPVNMKMPTIDDMPDIISKMEQKWFVYLLECCDGSFYCGISTDVDKRMEAHATGKGSKYVYNKGFRRLIGCKECSDRSEASKEEYRIKRLKRKQKLELIQGSL